MGDGQSNFSEAQPELGWGGVEEVAQEPDQGHFPSLFPDFPPYPDPSTILNPQDEPLDEWAHDQSAYAEIPEGMDDDPFDYFPDAQPDSEENAEGADEHEAALPLAPESSAGSSSKPEANLKGKSRSRPKRLTTRSPTTPKSPTATSSSSSKSRQLRTAVRKPAVAGSSRQAAEPATPTHGDEEVSAHRRRTHNTVEKRYRGRLNEQFESLLAALPSRSDDPTSPTSTVGGDDKRLSKGAVLDLAQRRIQELQEEHAVLMAERDALREQEEDILRRAGWDFNQDRGDNTEPDASNP